MPSSAQLFDPTAGNSLAMGIPGEITAQSWGKRTSRDMPLTALTHVPFLHPAHGLSLPSLQTREQ